MDNNGYKKTLESFTIDLDKKKQREKMSINFQKEKNLSYSVFNVINKKIL